MDRITTLPQSMLESILCLLPIEEAARTSILSREWRYKWTKIPKLEFNGTTVEIPSEMKQCDWSRHISDSEYIRIRKELMCKLFNAIYQVLLLRQGPIHEFTLAMHAFDTCYEIDQIILHLSRNHAVEKLNFYFIEHIFNDHNYVLPLSFFSLHHLTDLDLHCCDINHKPLFNGFGSLTRLSLYRTRILKETLLHLLSNCPSLKSLHLILDERDFISDEKPSIMELFRCLPVIEHLTTWGYIIPALVQASVPEELPTSLIHLKYVCIEDMSFIDGYGVPFLAALIKCSPNLEKIKLKIIIIYEEGDEIEPDQLEKDSLIWEEYSDVRLEHLSELEIKHFTDFEPGLEFVKFILARSPNLKKVKFSMDDKNEESEMLEFLSSAPHASPVEIAAMICDDD